MYEHNQQNINEIYDGRKLLQTSNLSKFVSENAYGGSAGNFPLNRAHLCLKNINRYTPKT